jgi:NAD(P)-dependent dehydrogenase (short-subunit alcohol dehydrogenase family)
MHIDLSGKTAIITGSTAGIGLAVAKGLAASGASVIVNGRTGKGVDSAVKAVEAAAPGAEVAGFAADLGDASGCSALAAAHKRCDILVNNLGISRNRTFSRFPIANGAAFLKSTSCPACAYRAPICLE